MEEFVQPVQVKIVETPVVLLLSARSDQALQQMSDNLASHLTASTDTMRDVAFTLQTGRKGFSHRRIVVADSAQSAVEQLKSPALVGCKATAQSTTNRPIVFAFTGQGSSTAGDAEQDAYLYENAPVFRETVDYCVDLLNAEFVNHRQFSWASGSNKLVALPAIPAVYLSQVELFVTEVALAAALAAVDVVPDAVVGHSLGEYAAACMAGALSMPDALRIVAGRALLMQQLPEGLMMSVQLSRDLLQRHLTECPEIDLAAVNSSTQCVVSGVPNLIEQFQQRLIEDNVTCKVLSLPHAFHSRHTDAITEQLRSVTNQCVSSAPHTTFMSTVTGGVVSGALSASHWTDHLVKPVLFTQALSALTGEDSFRNAVFVEVGPGRVLTNLIRKQLESTKFASVIACQGEVSALCEQGSFVKALGQLWLQGVHVEWSALYNEQSVRRVHLPTYPFQHKQYWISAPSAPTLSSPPRDGLNRHTSFLSSTTMADDSLHCSSCESVDSTSQLGLDLDRDVEIEARVATVWERFLRVSPIGRHDTYSELGGDSLMAVRLASILQEEFGGVVNSSLCMTHDTIARQAEHFSSLVEEASSSRSAVFVKLRAGELGRLPLILVHAIGGTINSYTDLVATTHHSRPVYAFQSLAPSGAAAPYCDFRLMCSDYVQELLQVFPARDQRLVLGGSSFGGIAAYEMAGMMTRLGRPVPLVVMMDAPIPGSILPFEGATPLLMYLFAEKVGLTGPMEQALVAMEGEEDKQIDFIYEQAVLSGSEAHLPQHDKVHCVMDTWNSHGAAMFAHTAQPYGGDVLFFRALEASPRLHNKQHTAWMDLATNNFEVRSVKGSHLSMMLQPCAGQMAQHIHAVLQSRE